MGTPTPCEVPAEVAFEAARDRALRTTDALIGAEAQIVDLNRRLGAALRELREVQEVNERLLRAEENHWMPTDAGPPEWVCTSRGELVREVVDVPDDVRGGDGDAADPVGYIAAVGQAD